MENIPDGEELSLSPPVDILENANSASGKLGGVAGVLHGVHTCPKCVPGP